MYLHLPVAGMEVNWLLLVLAGTGVGVMGGLLGVGGGFLMTPMLNVLFGVPYNYAVGSSLSQILGMSSAAALKHRRLGNVDVKLGLVMSLSAPVGVYGGVSVVERLKTTGVVYLFGREVGVMTLVMSLIYFAMLVGTGVPIIVESLRSLGRESPGGMEPSSLPLARRLHGLRVPPYVSFERAGVENISLWIPVLLGATTGFVCGLLGVGGGFIVTPALIYLLGCPTHTAIGTGLFQIVAASALGTVGHSLGGNVDPVLVILLVLGSAVGSQGGAVLSSWTAGGNLRLYLGIMMMVGACMVVVKVLFL